ncbi:MAG: transporter [Gammaproteobacteria bacterium]|nr:transporter [Gammaproteobacteria bacterium]
MSRIVHALLTALVLGLAHPVMAAPITSNTALPVAKGGFIVREQLLRRSFEDDAGPANRDLEVNGLLSIVGYGVAPRLAVFAALPYLDKTLKVTINGQRTNRSSEGFGDLKLFGRYTLLQRDAKSQTFRLGVFGGVKVPTGDDDKKDRFGRLPIPLQTGTGAWDSFAGIVATYQTSDFQIDAQLSAERNGEANDFEAGNEIRADLSVQYRFLPNTLNADTQSFLYGVLEVTAFNQRKHRIAGMSDPNSGGTTVYLTPGIQYVTRKYILEAALQLPVQQNLHGTALKTDYVFTAGFRVNF